MIFFSQINSKTFVIENNFSQISKTIRKFWLYSVHWSWALCISAHPGWQWSTHVYHDITHTWKGNNLSSALKSFQDVALLSVSKRCVKSFIAWRFGISYSLTPLLDIKILYYNFSSLEPVFHSMTLYFGNPRLQKITTMCLENYQSTGWFIFFPCRKCVLIDRAYILLYDNN